MPLKLISHHNSFVPVAVMLSKAHLIHFSLELSKKLEIYYKAPPMPVNVSFTGQAGIPLNMEDRALSPGSDVNSEAVASGVAPDLSSLQAMFAPKDTKPNM